MGSFSFDQTKRIKEREDEFMTFMSEIAFDSITDVHVTEAEGMYRVSVRTNGYRGMPEKMDFITGTHVWDRFMKTFGECWTTWSMTAAPLRRQMGAKGFPYIQEVVDESTNATEAKDNGDGTVTVAM